MVSVGLVSKRTVHTCRCCRWLVAWAGVVHVCQNAVYAFMFICGFDAAVAMCGLGKCCLLHQSWATVWVGRSGAYVVW